MSVRTSLIASDKNGHHIGKSHNGTLMINSEKTHDKYFVRKYTIVGVMISCYFRTVKTFV